MLSLLFALALLQAPPPADARASVPASPAADAADADTPKGAPTQDYDFVAWCHGALAGHMALYDQVKPELDGIERPNEVAADAKSDKAQMQAGRDYLALYTRALNGVDKARPGPLLTRRKADEAAGARIWDAAKVAAPRTRMWSWLLWDLPGRCETASKALETSKGRLAALHSHDSPLEGVATPAVEPTGATTPATPTSIDDALSTAPPSSTPPPADAAPDLRGPK